MGILVWIFIGLVAGMGAKYVLPGKDPGGVAATIVVGIAGALIGGLVGTTVSSSSITGFDAVGIILAVFGAIVVLFGFRLIVDRSKA